MISGPSLRRVSVHADAGEVDLALPDNVPVADLMPSIAEILAGPGYRYDLIAPYRLVSGATPGWDSSKTLAQNGVRDGAVLLATCGGAEPAAPRFDDAAEAVAHAVCAVARPLTPKAARLHRALLGSWPAAVAALLLLCTTGGDHHDSAAAVAAGVACLSLVAAVAARRGDGSVTVVTLALWATGFAAVAGFLAVPGDAVAPKAVLAAAAAAAVSVLAIRIHGGTVVFTTLAITAALVAVGAFGSMLCALPLQVVGALGAAMSLVALQASAWASVTVGGLSPRPRREATAPDAPVIRAHGALKSLVAALSITCALGGIGTVIGTCVGAPRCGGAVFAATIGAALLLRARSHTDRFQVWALSLAGIVTLSAALVAATVVSRCSPLGAAVLAGAALCGLCAPAPIPSPLMHRFIELAEYLVLTAVAPLTCWLCGLFGAGPLLALV
jgi:type VII secretion integral membrane protein EccD